MRSSASIGGHPIHPMLIPFPIGLWVFSFVADLIFLWRGNPVWEWVAFYTLAGGCIGAALAAVVGTIDLLGVQDNQAFRTGVIHGGLNVLALLLFTGSLYLRTIGGEQMLSNDSSFPVMLSAIGVLVICITGWLGGQLVFKHGVGVEERRTGNIES